VACATGGGGGRARVCCRRADRESSSSSSRGRARPMASGCNYIRRRRYLSNIHIRSDPHHTSCTRTCTPSTRLRQPPTAKARGGGGGECNWLAIKKKKIITKKCATWAAGRAKVYGTNIAADVMREEEIEKRLGAHIILYRPTTYDKVRL